MKNQIILLNVAALFLTKKVQQFTHLRVLDKSYISTKGYLAAYQKLEPLGQPTFKDVVDDIYSILKEIPFVSIDRVRDFYYSTTMTKKRSPNIFFVSEFSQEYICIVNFLERKEGVKKIIDVSEELVPFKKAIYLTHKDMLLNQNSAVYIPVKHEW